MNSCAASAREGMVGASRGDSSPGLSSLSLLSPAFLTEFNLYVMLRSFCVVLVVAFAQMLTLGVGQLNLSIGALGGLVAIVVGGVMEKFGLPISARCRARPADRRRAAGLPTAS